MAEWPGEKKLEPKQASLCHEGEGYGSTTGENELNVTM